MHVNTHLPSSGDRLTHMPEHGPIYKTGRREAMDIKHFAQECKPTARPGFEPATH